MIINIILVVSLFLDGILTNYLPYMTNDLSLFTPLFSVVALLLIYPVFQKEKKKYLIYSFIYGIIYDFLYTNLLFIDGLIFVLLALIIMKIYRYLGTGYIKVLLNIFIVIVIYELLFVSIIMIFNLVPITPERVIYKITHSLIINLIYGEIIYLILSILPKKYLKVPLN